MSIESEDWMREFEAQKRVAKACDRGNKKFTPICRHELYAYLSERNDAEIGLAWRMIWDGAPWWFLFGIWVIISLPFKIIAIAAKPNLVPDANFDYDKVSWDDDWWLKWWYFDLGTDVIMLAPHVFLLTQLLTWGNSDV